MAERKRTYGRTIKGELITDELIEKIVREAEEGYDVDELLEQIKSAESRDSSVNGQAGSPRADQRPPHRS
jgi:hypothetical protein